MAGTDKTTRILMMYTQLASGGRIHKNSFCVETEIDRRTFDRDIEDIRLFLSESYSGRDLIYDRYEENYYLEGGYQQKVLSGMEITMLLEMIRASDCLREDEYKGLIDSVVKTGELNKRRVLEKISQRYVNRCFTGTNRAAILKMQWDLQQCIVEQDTIKLQLTDGSIEMVYPVELKLYKQNFYLFAYVQSEILKVFYMNQIEAFQISWKKFDKKLFLTYEKLDEKVTQSMLEKERKKHEKN